MQVREEQQGATQEEKDPLRTQEGQTSGFRLIFPFVIVLLMAVYYLYDHCVLFWLLFCVKWNKLVTFFIQCEMCWIKLLLLFLVTIIVNNRQLLPVCYVHQINVIKTLSSMFSICLLTLPSRFKMWPQEFMIQPYTTILFIHHFVSTTSQEKSHVYLDYIRTLLITSSVLQHWS